MRQDRIRNFSIIAHIDHGKSTLADRLLEQTHTIGSREARDQFLDSMELEREKGITIKLQSVRLFHDGYMLNLIDTPGHVDFSYEVARSLAACEGALLLVDASQGIEAQTVSNVYLALEHDLEIIPVINKTDLPHAEPERVQKELEEFIGINREETIFVSAKEGTGVDKILEAIVERVPPPSGDREAPLRGLIFDSHYDPYQGVIAYVRVKEGEIHEGMRISMISNRATFEVSEVGVFRPAMTPEESLKAGQAGYIVAGIKNIQDAKVGDTITSVDNPASTPLASFQGIKPMVFCGLYPSSDTKHEELRKALEKLQLNDSSLQFEPDNSPSLGFGFHCGFLGNLHMEVVKQRLEREYGLDLVVTAPNVVYKAKTKNSEEHFIERPSSMPSTGVEYVAEPFVEGTFILPEEYIGPVMEL